MSSVGHGWEEKVHAQQKRAKGSKTGFKQSWNCLLPVRLCTVLNNSKVMGS